MKLAAFTFLGVALSLAVPAASRAQSEDRGHRGGSAGAAPSADSGNRQEQQAQSGSGRDRAQYCADLKQRAEKLRDEGALARNQGDAAQAEEPLDRIESRMQQDCK